MPPPPSEAHTHFELKKRVDRVTGQWVLGRECIHCRAAIPDNSVDVTFYSKDTSTSVLLDHIEKLHNDIRLRRQQRPTVASSSTPSKRPRTTNQLSITQSFVKVNNDAVRPALAELFARCSWAHHCIESPEFIAALDAYRNSTIRPPTRAGLRHDMLNLAQQMRASVVKQLRAYCRSSPLTIAIDGWTNVRQDKVTNVMILCGGVAFYCCSIVNVVDRNTATWLLKPMIEVLHEIKREGLIFSALVADNEQVNKTLHRLLEPTFPFLVRSPCAAHLIQLCVNHALDIPAIQPIFVSMEELLRTFRSKEQRLKLRQVQMAANSDNSYLCLIKPCDTRWSSHLAAARRLLKLRTSVDMVLPQTPQFWSDLTEVIRFLEPFAAATDVVQSDRSTLYDFYTQFKTLIKHVKDTPVSSPFHIAKDSINNIIIGVWEKHVVMKAVITTAHLSFDSTVEAAFSDKMPAARQWLADFASQYAVYWTLSTAATVQEARSLLTDEYSAFVGRRAGSCFANLQDDINEIRAAHVLQKRQFDPKAVWALYLDSAPVLAHAAIALLSIAGSEACVERSFSAQGTVHNDRRNRLKDSMVEAEMFIKFNRLALRKAAGEAVGRDRLELMTDEYDGLDDAPSVTELFNRVPVAEQDVKQPEQQQQQQQQQQPEEQEEQQLDSELEEAVAVPVVSSIPRPPPSTDDVTRFVVDYVRNTPHTITARFRWQPWHEQQLQAAGAAFEPPMRDTVTVLRRKVMQYVRAQAEQEAASDEVSAIVDIEQSE